MEYRETIADFLESGASVIRRKRDIPGEIAAVFADLRNINEVEDLERHPAWQKIKMAMVGQIADWRNRILVLNKSGIDKNRTQIDALIALEQAGTHLLAIVETTLAAKSDRLERLRELRKIIQKEGLGETTSIRTLQSRGA